MILEAILDGRFEHRLPTEEELSRMLRVSRASVRTALQDLELQGLVTRRRALGTTINMHVHPLSLGLHRLVGFERLLTEKGHRPKVEISWRIGAIDRPFVQAFGISPETQCLLTGKRYVVADGKAAIGIADAVPVDRLRDVHIPSVIPASIFEFTRRYCTSSIDHATVSIVPMISPVSQPLADSIADGRAFVRLHETHYSSDAQVMGWSIIDVNDDYIQFDLVRRH